MADFGLSRMAHDVTVPTTEWATVLYMAPEYLDNRLMKASDVWSFGVLLWQMYFGRQPFAEHHQGEPLAGTLGWGTGGLGAILKI